MIIEFFIISSCWTTSLVNSRIIGGTLNSQITLAPERICQFKELIYSGHAFVDKTLFIKDLLEHASTSTLILCPRKWGKSINLDMLKTFLEIEVDADGNEILPKESTKNYRLFRKGEIVFNNRLIEKLSHPLLIAEHKAILEQHQGNYPVVYIDFSDTCGENYFAIEHRIKAAIRRVFQQHKYLVNTLRKLNSTDPLQKHSQMFESITNDQNFTSDILLESVACLCALLHRHFGKSAFVLFEHYDRPLHGVLRAKKFPVEDVDLTLRFMQDFMGCSFSDNQHLEQALIMGTFQLEQPGYQPRWKHYSYYGYTGSPDPMLKHFGFEEENVQELLKLYYIADQASLAKRWFDGYRASAYLDDRFYNPVSVIEFLPEKRIGFKMSSNVSLLFLEKLMAFSTTLREETLMLINKHPVIIDENWLRFGVKTITILNDLIHDNMNETSTDIVTVRNGIADINYHVLHVINGFLLANGFLTPIQHFDGNNKIRAQVPNNQVALELINRLTYAYRMKYHVQNKQIRDAAFDLKNLLLDKNITYYFNESFNAVLKCLPPFDILLNSSANNEIFGPEDPIRTSFYYLLLKTQTLGNFSKEVFFPRKTTPDAVFYDYVEHRGAAIYTAFNLNSTDEALANAKLNRRHLLNFTNATAFKYVGINVLVDKTVQIAAVVEPGPRNSTDTRT